MANKVLRLNTAQKASVILNPKHEIQVWGRGDGKSTGHSWKMKRIIETMPRSSSVITGRTYTQILTRTIPPVIAFFEKLGYIRDKDFFIGKKPPKAWKWREPLQAPVLYDHYFIFGTPRGSVGFNLASQDRVGSSRGLNTDFEFTDESLTLDIDRYNKETHATNRGCLEVRQRPTSHRAS